MDLIRLLRSLEEFLYELVGWLVFYPRTLWRVFVRPGEVAKYTQREFGKELEHRFADAISPVLMLILSVAIAHAIEMTVKVDPLNVSGAVGKLLFGSEEGLLLTRSAIFCIFALGAALSTLWRQGLPVNRDTLRLPFSIQAFLACPFVILLSLSQLAPSFTPKEWHIGVMIELVAVIWYLWARTKAFTVLNDTGHLRAFAFVLASFLLTSVFIVTFAVTFIL